MKWRTMDRKQKEDLVTALLEKGETYREITKQLVCLQIQLKRLQIKWDWTRILQSHPEHWNYM